MTDSVSRASLSINVPAQSAGVLLRRCPERRRGAKVVVRKIERLMTVDEAKAVILRLRATHARKVAALSALYAIEDAIREMDARRRAAVATLAAIHDERTALTSRLADAHRTLALEFMRHAGLDP